MTKPEPYTDADGDELVMGATVSGGVVVQIVSGTRSLVMRIEAGDVRAEAAKMLAAAGLPDRWAELRKRVTEDEARYYRDSCTFTRKEAADHAEAKWAGARAVLRYMDEIEAGR